MCFSCLLDRELGEFLADTSGFIQPQWERFREVLREQAEPRTTLRWLRNSPAAPVARDMVMGISPIDHATLDRSTHSGKYKPSIEHLRGMLTAADLLPVRDNHLARITERLDRQIRGAPEQDQPLLRMYVRRQLLPRVRRQSRKGHSASVAYGAHNYLVQAIDLTRWAKARGRTIASLTQLDADLRFATLPAARVVPTRSFLRWAIASGHAPRLDLPAVSVKPPIHFIDEDHLWELARQALHDETWSDQDKAAAALVLLYGQSPARIAGLKTTDITEYAGEIFLRLGIDPIHVDPPLSTVLVRLMRPGSPTNGDGAWLFPGVRPGRHVDPTTIIRRLKRRGVAPRAARNTALLSHAATLPSVVLADLLGITVTSAEHWRAAAGAAWGSYPVRRLNTSPPGAAPHN